MALVDAGVLAEIPGKKRDRTFGYARYLDLLKTETYEGGKATFLN